MAPTAPKKRPSMRRKATSNPTTSTSTSTSTTTAPVPKSLLTRPFHASTSSTSSSFINSKRDKRTIKHSAFINRIEKAHSTPLKRRRPSKKLVATLESLGDVLGDIESGELGGGLGKGESNGDGKIKQKTLRTGAGAMKRREKMERAERERFGRNMAQLVGAVQVPVVAQEGEKMVVEGEEKTNATGSRWAALRGFISQTMEQKEEFRKP